MKKVGFGLLAAVLATSVFANPVGKIDQLSGGVNVGDGKQVVRAVQGTPVVQGGTVLVPSNASAVIVLNNGCRINLGAGQQLVLDATQPCAAIQAAVRSLPTVAGQPGSVTVAGGTSGGLMAGVTMGALLPVGMMFVAEATDKDNANSPR